MIGSHFFGFQLSLEAPQLFRLVHRINLAQTPQELRETLKDPAHGLDEDDIRAFFIFCGGKPASMKYGTAEIIGWRGSLAKKCFVPRNILP